MPEAHLTPMFRQYRSLKANHPSAILLFRMGDFYEMFFDDAKKASPLLELTLTARGKGTENVVPMCGFPHHQLEQYTARLVRAGQNVAVCEQMEDPRKTKGLVKRDVVRVVTPGTVTDPTQLDARANAWVAAIASVSGTLGAAFLDASTGEFLAWQAPAESDVWDALGNRLASFAPREIVYPEEFEWPDSFRNERTAGAVLTATDPWTFTPAEADRVLRRRFDVASLDGFGFKARDAAVAAAGGLLQFVQETQKCGLEHIDSIAVHEPSRSLLLDLATRRNLEIERSIRGGGTEGSLLHAVDDTTTPAGARLLRRWLLAPLRSPEEIDRRLEAVDELVHRTDLREATRDRLKNIQDIERLLAKTVTGTANARDLAALRASLGRLPGLKGALSPATSNLLRAALDDFDPCSDVAELLDRAIAEDPPVSIKEGGIIGDGYHAELDELRATRSDGRSYIASLEAKEREATGIANLKVKFNKVFGYFIEVSKSNIHLVPDHYHRKQTIVGGERYVTPEIKEHESHVLDAQERIESLEYDLFIELRRRIASTASRLKAAARIVATFDVLASFAQIAVTHDFRRPKVHTGTSLRIVAGRHPVVEQSLVDERFTANETELDAGGEALAILTGPNMGGKSTYLRQVALIVILAQTGSFVPAEEADIGIVDRVFCRVGASDSLAEGQSTFMVEMTETANILHNATGRSLVLLDEIGRGTSTFDGLSIAWSVVEFLHSHEGNLPRTLFATHYHELTELAVELERVRNYRMAVRERGDKVVFLHRVEAGAADRSYGIHVARLAGVPDAVIQRAREILSNLERDEFGRDGLPRRARRGETAGRPDRTQMDLFGAGGQDQPADPDPALAEILAELREKDPERLTPLEALQLLSAWHRRLHDRS